eukprot:CAMPEP_0176260312 /NCGR_PEP_ID=MMETSP0121_2-20121125/39517_1 /TAXON_ID=160619 /ORGANISM="Kryptoperidinium foliaceum, Strain CCMP 1326" /LENGTH=99 /DNA_ID=CAMNT_0017600217 /DNA_START=43 /DNA_END=342 /DNA_ORIENTATION=+
MASRGARRCAALLLAALLGARAAPITQESIDGMFKVLDADGSGGVSMAEVIESVGAGGDEAFRSRVEEHFRATDLNGDNQLDKTEAGKFLKIVSSDGEL